MTPWAPEMEFHMVGGNTGMFTHVWGRDKFEELNKTEYWEEAILERAHPMDQEQLPADQA